MRILIDTHIQIWQLQGDEKLSNKFREILSDEANEIFISIASLWEMAIKSSKGKLELHGTIADWMPADAGLLHIIPAHIQTLKSVPFHHTDPFDRMQIAQALTENLNLMSVDADFKNYGIKLT